MHRARRRFHKLGLTCEFGVWPGLFVSSQAPSTSNVSSRSSATAAGRSNTCSAPRSSFTPPSGCRRWKWPGAPASAARRSGAGSRRYAEEGVDGLLARQDPQARQGGHCPCRRRRGRGADLRRAARRGHPLDGPGHGQGRRPFAERRPAHLGTPSPAAPPAAHLQAVQGSRLRREGRGHRRALHAPAPPRRGAVDRREEPDPGPRPNPAGPAAQARQVRRP